MNLQQIQRAVFDVIRQPLSPSQRMRPRLADGRSTRGIADEIVKPNDRLTSRERLEIYNQQYWFRILDCFTEDFLGLRAIIGERRFEKLAIAYLTECPSESFTLRNLGARLEGWLKKHPGFAPGMGRLAVDMVRLEWAEIQAFDGLALPRITARDVGTLSDGTVFRVQPHLQLLDLAYPVDDLLVRIRNAEPRSNMVSNAVLEFPRRTKTRRLTLPKPEKVYLVVHRVQNSVYFKRLTRESFALVRALRGGKTLGEAIEAVLKNSRHDADELVEHLQMWFENWAALGWFAKEPSR